MPHWPLVVVEADLAGGGVDHDGVQPAGQLDEQPVASPLEERAVPCVGPGSPSRRHAAATATGSRIWVWISTTWDSSDLLAAHVKWGCRRDGAAARFGLERQGPARDGHGSRRSAVGSPPDARSSSLYMTGYSRIFSVRPQRQPSPATPDAVTPRGVDLRVGSAEVASRPLRGINRVSRRPGTSSAFR